ncbi:MAG: Flavin-dependent oxidoreductase, luciferase family [Chloroflexi bacterium]|jgi:FMNH2-dependent dimethyl sulfone monooxygenase|nr:MAG: Flavin-dependent oxidoreductase, luciferase family [Chloroflexota bacterium]|tara:strand:- start:8087 stop:9205 length:1119 start_codon:yes stop_codon:yes gene_type:complete
MNKPEKRSFKNKLALGIFAQNCSSGYTITKSADRWVPSWENNLALAQKADKIGIDFLLSIARWRGFGGQTDPHGSNLETFTWATGLLASTKNINIFSTVHLPLINPVYASKIMVTANHIGNGRFGLNAVCGWNTVEFNMHGVDFNDHTRRYDHGEEWMTVVNKIWDSNDNFDYAGDFFNLKNVGLQPKPLLDVKPLIMNAGRSDRGLDFAVKFADYIFLGLRDLSSELVAKDVGLLKKHAQKSGRNHLGICTNIFIVCKPTQKEAENFYYEFAIENADHEAINNLMAERGIDKLPDKFQEAFKIRAAAGHGAPNIVGDPDFVTQEIIRLHELGIDGFAIGLFNYIDDLDFLSQTVIPQLESLGYRKSISKAD